MKGFIEVTEITENSAVLVPIGKITAILKCDEGAFIETGFDGKGKSTGICTAENYEEIKQKIKLSEV